MEYHVPFDYENPDWDNCGRVHDWKNYAAQPLRDIWDTFSDHQKIIISASLGEVASREEWD